MYELLFVIVTTVLKDLTIFTHYFIHKNIPEKSTILSVNDSYHNLLILTSSTWMKDDFSWVCSLKQQAPPPNSQQSMIYPSYLKEPFACQIPSCLKFLYQTDHISWTIPIELAARVIVVVWMFDCKFRKILFNRLFRCSRCKSLEILHPIRPCVLMKLPYTNCSVLCGKKSNDTEAAK